MLTIRFFRTGKKNQPSFKIVVTDKRNSSNRGRFAEEVGFYNPLTKEKVLKAERLLYWMSVGAKPSATVHNLLVSEKIIEGKKIDLHKESKKEKPEETAPEKPTVAAEPKPEEVKQEAPKPEEAKEPEAKEEKEPEKESVKAKPQQAEEKEKEEKIEETAKIE